MILVENSMLFVDKNSIVRKIWGNADTVLFIFAGAAAEFALNKAVDWLYYTGKLPADPIGRLFSTVTYAHRIIFSDVEKANKAIDNITSIHKAVEQNRQASIPDWAYRDVLYMLIHYSIASFELLERKLSAEEKEEVFNVFYRVGDRMHLKDLPTNYIQWTKSYAEHLKNDLEKSKFTVDLFKQYKKHLGSFRYSILIESQKLLVTDRVKKLLGFHKFSWMKFIIPFYKLSRMFKLDGFVKSILLPAEYKAQIKALDVA
jgi:mpaB/rubber oxygenase-like protein